MPRKTKKATRKTTTRKTTTRRTTAKRKPAKRTTAKRTTTRRKTTTTKRKTTARKTATTAKVKTVVAKRTAPKAPKKISVGTLKQAYTKSQIMTYLAESTELTKKDISNVFDALGNLMQHHLKSKGGPGEFTIPGLMKCVVKRKPATKARKGINPFTGEPMTFKAKPARNIVKVRPLKKLKEMVG